LGFYKGSPYPLLQRIVKLLYDAGVVMVAAAGNYKTGVRLPAGAAPAGAVGTSLAATGEGGETVTGAVTICIPADAPAAAGGECLRSPGAAPVGGTGQRLYGRGSGTSQATAHVTGVVALMLQENPTLTPDEVRMILYETAEHLFASPLAQGAGLIRAGEAVEK